MSVSSFQWCFLASTFGWFYLVALSVQKEESIVRAEFPCPLKICWSSCLHLPCHAATLELLTEAVVETEPAVLLLSSATDYYLHNIPNDRAWLWSQCCSHCKPGIKACCDQLSPVCKGIFSQVSVFWASNNASKSFSTFSNEGNRAIRSMPCLNSVICWDFLVHLEAGW